LPANKILAQNGSKKTQILICGQNTDTKEIKTENSQQLTKNEGISFVCTQYTVSQEHGPQSMFLRSITLSIITWRRITTF